MEQRLGDVATSQETGNHWELEEAGRAVPPHPCRERPSHTWTQTCDPRAGRAALVGSPWSVLCCYCPGTPYSADHGHGGTVSRAAHRAAKSRGWAPMCWGPSVPG